MVLEEDEGSMSLFGHLVYMMGMQRGVWAREDPMIGKLVWR